MTIQLSLLPDELPDLSVSSKKKRKRSLKSRFRKLLRKEGYYNYAKIAEEALSKPDAYIRAKFGLSKDELKTLLGSVFGHACCYQETMESFLEKLRTTAGFKLENYNDV